MTARLGRAAEERGPPNFFTKRGNRVSLDLDKKKKAGVHTK